MSRKQEHAIAALLSESTLATAAERVGIAERTMRNWLAIPLFAEEYRQRRRAVLDQAVASLQGSMGEAAGTLRHHLSAEKAADSIRAASSLLALALKAHEQLDVVERLAEVEAKLKELQR